MPPPPVTPSPHRFVVKKQTVNRKIPLAQEYKPRPPPPPPRSTPRPNQAPSSTPQFVSTPRFHVPSTPRRSATPSHLIATPKPPESYAGPTPSASRYRTPARPEVKEEDAINSSFDDDVLRSIEVEADEEGDGSADLADDFTIETRNPKRRRLSSSPHYGEDQEQEEPQSSMSLPLLSSPVQPLARSVIPASASRFITSLPPSTPQAATTVEVGQTTFRKPPPFRPPSPSATQGQRDPLPEQFSPHKKGQKYVQGGLAAELQGWLFNIESTSNVATRSRGEDWVVKMVVDEVSGDQRIGMTMVRGRQIHPTHTKVDIVGNVGDIRVILAGEGQGIGLQRGSKVEQGSVIGINGPVWEVLTGEGKWGVGCDWKVLHG